jgi:hypothetical protein
MGQVGPGKSHQLVSQDFGSEEFRPNKGGTYLGDTQTLSRYN